jgi:hypothetical protein
LNPQAAVLHRHALHHRELIVAAMRELAHQELGVAKISSNEKAGGLATRRLLNSQYRLFRP